jgi:hypothetical protein
MSTANSSFVYISGPTSGLGSNVLIGSAVVTFPAILVADHQSSRITANNPNATIIDRVTFDLSLVNAAPSGGKIVSGFAKNAAIVLTLTGTTPITVDLTSVVATTGVIVAGDSSFTTVFAMVLNNLGVTDLTISPGGSNPSRIPQFTGTTPTLTIPAAGVVTVYSLAGYAVDSTHKTFTITPTSGGTLAIAVGGA